jgi:hypothetical protein
VPSCLVYGDRNSLVNERITYIMATGKRISAITYHSAMTEGLQNIMTSEPAKREEILRSVAQSSAE